MDDNNSNHKIPFFEYFKVLFDLKNVLILIYGIFLFDSLAVFVYKTGLIEIDFSNFIEPAKIPFLLLYLVTFGIVSTGLSSCFYVLVYKIFYRALSSIFLALYYRTKKNIKLTINKNIKNISLVYNMALITEKTFWLDYITNHNKTNKNIQHFIRVTYAFIICILLNLFTTMEYGNSTILYFIYTLFIYDHSFLIKIFTGLCLITVVLSIIYGFKLSITYDETKIYIPEDKYLKLEKEVNSK